MLFNIGLKGYNFENQNMAQQFMRKSPDIFFNPTIIVIIKKSFNDSSSNLLHVNIRHPITD